MVSNGGVIGKASGLGTGTTPAQTTAITSSGDFTTASGCWDLRQVYRQIKANDWI